MPAKKKSTGKKLSWIDFVKKYAKEHKIPYGDAMSKAKTSYKKQ